MITPAATGLGLTLALFERHLPAEERPKATVHAEWIQLPPGPR